MKYLFLILTLSTLTTYAQTDEEGIKQTINNLFDGMRKTDSALLRSAFAPGALLQTVAKNREGMVRVRTENVDSFIVSVMRPRKELLDERIRFDVIKIDADLAIAWTPYEFYIGDKFSHCGVNSFQLVRFNGSWKIQYLIDTRRREGCK